MEGYSADHSQERGMCHMELPPNETYDVEFTKDDMALGWSATSQRYDVDFTLDDMTLGWSVTWA